ncbi:pilus assembly protein [Paraburkholderia sp. D15]|uniref:pilus assembly protein n=1 Tax=Paraburkholderia sp. D15 TaxID=2880218 RepID=UPI00247913C8|nr:pilus assembly protein [Paraburkholderia sp. D15]WGS51402.1 pilus assembly protein [Paraburkholderia sp. D15]
MTDRASFLFLPRAGRCGVLLLACALCGLLGACAKDMGYGVGAQAERAAMAQQANRDPAPDTPGMYLGLIDQMQSQGLYFASLAHIDAFEKQYGATPDTHLLRADALRMTGQPAAAADAYGLLLKTPLAARGYRGLGLVAGAAGDFARAAQQLEQAAQLAPTDAVTLSDLGYARLRNGDVNGARVPLMKAAELDRRNPKIVSNVVLYLLASGDQAQALAVMNEQKFAPDVRIAIRGDAAKVAVAERARSRGTAPVAGGEQVTTGGAQAVSGAGAGTVASVQGIEPAPRVLQRFAQ